jgi:type I restriction enzyme S subunit
MITDRGRFKPYPEYKDSGVEWLGKIPKHWQITRLSEYATIISGYPFDSERFNRYGGMPVVRIRDLNHFDTEINYTGPIVAEALIARGDIIIGMDGEFSVARWRGSSALLNQRLCCVRPRIGLHIGFIAYVLPIPLKRINDVTYSTTVKHLSAADIRKISMATPLFDEQRAIASFLDREISKIDTLIAKMRRLIELLQEKRSAFVANAVTKGLDSSVLNKDTRAEWIGQIPDHWGVERNRYLFREAQDRSSLGEEELLTVSHITGVTRRSDKNVNMIEAESHEGYKICVAGDLAINTMWAWMGALGVASENGMVSPSYNVYRIICTQLSPRYYDYLCRIPNHVAEIVRHSKGIWKSRLRLYPESFQDIRTPVPPISEQRRITAFLDQEVGEINGLIYKVQNAIDHLAEYRTVLISAAVTGKIDIRDEGAYSSLV